MSKKKKENPMPERTPFVRASCGCIVIPTNKPTIGRAESLDCIILNACDSSGHTGNEWLFGNCSFDAHKVVLDPNYKYRQDRQDKPRPLTDAETATVIQAIGLLVVQGYRHDILCKLLTSEEIPPFKAES